MNISGVKGTGILNETSYLNSKWSKYLSKTKKASLLRINKYFFLTPGRFRLCCKTRNDAQHFESNSLFKNTGHLVAYLCLDVEDCLIYNKF